MSAGCKRFDYFNVMKYFGFILMNGTVPWAFFLENPLEDRNFMAYIFDRNALNFSQTYK